jgi:hypothetical protein
MTQAQRTTTLRLPRGQASRPLNKQAAPKLAKTVKMGDAAEGADVAPVHEKANVVESSADGWLYCMAGVVGSIPGKYCRWF